MRKITKSDEESGSLNIIAENIATLRAIFPEVITEGPDGVSIDVDVLKQLVGGRAVTDSHEKFGLNWHGKRQARYHALKPSTGTLRPCPEESVDWDSTQNIMIEGDNLEVLKLLQKSYAGKVKLIYIDPPYNTGKDFVYPDNYQDSIRNYLEITGQVGEGGRKVSTNTEASGRFHTDWLNMMYPRLKLARDLLRDDGVIFISIDDGEVSHLRKMLDEIFGEDNFLNDFVWVNNLKGRQISGSGAARTHEHLLLFAKNTEATGVLYTDIAIAKRIAPSVYRISDYSIEEDERGPYVIKNELYNTNCKFNEETRRNLVFKIFYNPATGAVDTGDLSESRSEDCWVEILPHINSNGRNKFHAWRWNQEKVKSEYYDLLFRNTGSEWKVFTKVRTTESTVLKDLIMDISTQSGSRDCKALLEGDFFDFPKPVDLITFLLGSSTSDCCEDVIVDFFAGSGTTGEAVMKLNVERAGRRKFILVQLPEKTPDGSEAAKNGFNTISALTKARLRAAANKLRSENADYQGDLGFRVFKLDSSNIREWDPRAADIHQEIESFVKNIKHDRSEQDILFELLLKLGLDLCVPIKTRSLMGTSGTTHELHSIGGGVLLVCLSVEIPWEDVEGISGEIVTWVTSLNTAGDTTVVFRDSAFSDDVAKTNMIHTLQQHGIGTIRSI